LLENIPDELKALPQWVVWRWTWNGEESKWTKPPYQAKAPRRLASSTDSSTWASFDEAFEAYKRGNADGVGFVPLGTDPYTAVDLDNCLDDELMFKSDSEQASKIVKTLDSYTEDSPSGNGVRIFVKGRLKVTEDGEPTGRTRSKAGDFEVYDGLTAKLEQGGRYVTVTGHCWYGGNIAERQAELVQVYDMVFGTPHKTSEDVSPATRPSATLQFGDAQLLEKIEGSGQAEKFLRLWSGDTGGYRVDDNAGHSEADLALISILGWWADYDAPRTDRLFRQSRLYRPKWDEARGSQTYGELTIARAFEGKSPGMGYNPDRAKARAFERPETATAISDSKRLLHSYKNTDFGNAERLAARHGRDLLHCHEIGWLIWDGRRWRRDLSGAEVERRAKETIRAGLAEAASIENDDTRKTFVEFLVKSENRTRITAMIELAKSEHGIDVEVSAFDRNPYLFNCLNGTVDLRTGELRPHQREDYITQLCPVVFDPAARCPTWDAFQVTISGGAVDLVDFKQKVYGYSLTGVTVEQIMVILYGTGANGKSTELEVLRSMFGDYAQHAEFSTFEQQRKDSIRNDLARLRGARLVTATESDQGANLSESIVKSLTGGDTITARFLNKEYFEYTPNFTVFLATNHKPRIRGTDHGIWRRIRLIPYSVTIPPDEQDKHLKEKLLDELPGILAWVVRGCLAWQRDGLTPPQSVTAATAAYRQEMDTLADFLTEYFELGEVLTVPKRDFRDLYLKHCDENGDKSMSTKALKQAMLERGFIDDRSTTERWWSGLGLTDEGLEALRKHRGPMVGFSSSQKEAN
jgi:putative DNA primase/helicase